MHETLSALLLVICVQFNFSLVFQIPSNLMSNFAKKDKNDNYFLLLITHLENEIYNGKKWHFGFFFPQYLICKYTFVSGKQTHKQKLI